MADQPQYDWQQPKPQFQIGRLFGRAFQALTRNWRAVIIATLIVAILGVLSSFWQMRMLTTDGVYDPLAVADDQAAFWQITLISSLVIYLIYSAYWIFIDQISLNTSINRPQNMKAHIMRALKMMVPIFLVSLIVAIASYFAMIFFIVPGVFLLICWAVYAPTYLNEEEIGFFGCLGRSWSLTKGYRPIVWATGLIMLMILIVSTTLAFIPSTLIGGGGLEMFAGGAVDLTFGYWIATTISSFFTILVMAFYASYTNALYLELIDLKEGGYGTSTADVFS